MIRLWNHLITLDADRLPKKVFLWDYNIQNKNWSSDVEQLFDWLRLENIFEESKFCDLDVARDRIQEFLQSEWESEVHSKPKLREYIKFKETFHTESYLKVFLPKHKRSLIAQFRCGILPLHIETGRFKNITDPDTGKIRKLKAEERICPVCKSGEIENEIHFLCISPEYHLPRQMLFCQISNISPDFMRLSVEDKFIFVVCNFWKELSCFITEAWAIRKSILYI